MIILSKQRLYTYLICILLILSFIYNLKLVYENIQFKNQIGAKYMELINLTLFELDEGTASYWENELKKKNGDVLFDRYLEKLRVLSVQYHQMNGKLAIIGTQIDFCISQLMELKAVIDKHENTRPATLRIKKNIHFMTAVLSTVKKSLGDNEMKWFKEFSDDHSKTATIIWKRFKDFNNIKN